MINNETVKQEIARLREYRDALIWEMAGWDNEGMMDYTIYRDDYELEIAQIDRRIAYLTEEYVKRGIVFEPDF